MKTTSENELRRLTAQGLSWPQISERLGIGVSWLRVTGSVLGIRSGRQLVANALGEAWYRRHYEDHETIARISETAGISRDRVSRAIKAYKATLKG